MEIAGEQLIESWNKRLQHLPGAVGDAAFDDALVSITRRALRGVDGSRDERGNQSPERIKTYVKYVVDRKVKGAWSRAATPVRYEEGRVAARESATDLVGRLRSDRDADELLAKAWDALGAFERQAREVDARRMSWIAHVLVEHGIAGRGAEVVMLRAAREPTIDVGEHGLEVRYTPRHRAS